MAAPFVLPVLGKAQLRARLRAFDASILTTSEEQLALVPDSVWVGGIAYDVRLDPDFQKLGQCDPDGQVIVLNPATQGALRLRETLIHEVMHAMLHEAGYRGNTLKVKEETLVLQLSHLWFAVLRDNPLLVLYLVSHGKG